VPDTEFLWIEKFGGVNVHEVVYSKFDGTSWRYFFSFFGLFPVHEEYVITSFMIRPWEEVSSRRYYRISGIARGSYPHVIFIALMLKPTAFQLGRTQHAISTEERT
jgi:hypothetical protein